MFEALSKPAHFNVFQQIMDHGSNIIQLTYDSYINMEENPLTQAEEKNRELAVLADQFYNQLQEDLDLEREGYAFLLSFLVHVRKLKFNHDRLINYTRLKIKNKIFFSSMAAADMENLFQGTRDVYTHLSELVVNKNPVLFRQIFRETDKYELISLRVGVEHEERLLRGICKPQASTVYIQMLGVFEDILWHLHALTSGLKNSS